MGEPLSDAVALLEPSARIAKVVSGAGAWAVRREATGEPFYALLLDGSSRLSVEGRDPLVLHAGDFVLIPAARAFTMSSVDGGFAANASSPTAVLGRNEIRHGDSDAAVDVRLLVGHFSFGSPDADLLVSLLPDLVHVRGDLRLSAIVELVTDEARADRPARDAVLQRLLEVLLVEALRVRGPAPLPVGLTRGLADERLAPALRRMHDDPTRAWTVEMLAREASLSRSAFFNRFRAAVGVAPMDYLLSWRMALAKNLLRRSDIRLQEIAERVGYGSASAFSTAFARSVGMPPSRYASEGRV